MKLYKKRSTNSISKTYGIYSDSFTRKEAVTMRKMKASLPKCLSIAILFSLLQMSYAFSYAAPSLCQTNPAPRAGRSSSPMTMMFGFGGGRQRNANGLQKATGRIKGRRAAAKQKRGRRRTRLLLAEGTYMEYLDHLSGKMFRSKVIEAASNATDTIKQATKNDIQKGSRGIISKFFSKRMM